MSIRLLIIVLPLVILTLFLAFRPPRQIPPVTNQTITCQPTDFYCPITNQCQNPLQTECLAGSSDDLNQINSAYFAKYNQNQQTFDLSINFNDGTYANGPIRNLQLNRGEGIFYAKKVDNHWQIVVASRGSILCTDLTPFSDYPSAFIPDCADGNGNTVKR